MSSEADNEARRARAELAKQFPAGFSFSLTDTSAPVVDLATGAPFYDPPAAPGLRPLSGQVDWHTPPSEMVTASTIAAAPHPLLLKLWELARLGPGWDGHAAPPPGALACELAHGVFDAALHAQLPPARVVPDVEGGVGLYWFGTELLPGGSHRLVASISIDNEGTMASRCRKIA